MENKVILISVDGMRPDGFLQCGNPFIEELMRGAYYTLDGKTVLPSATLPAHMSMFHSVPPERHGITTNTYVPPVHAIPGLFEQLKSAGKSSAMYFGWEPLRDISRPGSLTYGAFIKAHPNEESVDTLLTDLALKRIEKSKPDFVFLYLVDTDEKGGHDFGWMAPEYLKTIRVAMDNVRRVVESCGEDYSVVITADHGGHDRSHGTDLPEDMTIPMIYLGKVFKKERFSGGSILDIAPTVAKLTGTAIPEEWEGKSLI